MAFAVDGRGGHVPRARSLLPEALFDINCLVDAPALALNADSRIIITDSRSGNVTLQSIEARALASD